MSEIPGLVKHSAVYEAKKPPTVSQPAQDIYHGPGNGALTAKDKAILEEYCGYKFNWPPEAGYPFPLEAMDLSQARALSGDMSDSDMMSQLHKYQQFSMRMSGEKPFSDEFLEFVAKRSNSPSARAFLEGGGQRGTYA